MMEGWEVHLEPFVDALAVELVATRENSHHLDFNQNHCDDHWGLWWSLGGSWWSCCHQRWMFLMIILMLKMYLSLFEVAHTDNTDGLLTVLSARLARVSGGCHCDHSADGEDIDECCVCRSRQPRHDNLRKEYDNYEAVGWKDLGRKFGHAGPRSSPTKFLPLATPNMMMMMMMMNTIMVIVLVITLPSFLIGQTLSWHIVNYHDPVRFFKLPNIFFVSNFLQLLWLLEFLFVLKMSIYAQNTHC